MFHHCNTKGGGYASHRHSHGAFQGGGHFGGGFRRPKYNVPLNITDTETTYEVAVYATGFAKENITLNVVDDVLYISGSKEITESPNFSRQEFPVKNFERSLLLNGLVEIEGISAKVENGVLHITLPKTKEAQRRTQKIEVQ